MSPFLDELPPLDAHAHLAPDVTPAQVRRLEGAVVFAMTRSLAEADYVSERRETSLVWGVGAHPSAYRDLAAFEINTFRRLLDRFAVVGEVGLDFKGGRRQHEIFDLVLEAIVDQPVLVSIHSTGMTGQVLAALEARRPSGPILHWFLGGSADIVRAVGLGCFFSVNAAMTDAQIEALPRDRVLSESDYPAASTIGSKRPGDLRGIEDRLAKLWQASAEDVRHRLFSNARRIAVDSGAIERMPSEVAGHLLAA